MSHRIPESELFQYAFGGNIVTESTVINQLCTPVGRAAINLFRTEPRPTPLNLQRGPLRMRIALLSQTTRETLDMQLEDAPPPDEINAYRGEMSWGEWLATSRRKGGATPAQRDELLEWNLEEMKERNRTHASNLEETVASFDQYITDATTDGRISSALLGEWRKAEPRLKVYVKDPMKWLDTHRGNAYPKQRVVAFAPDFDVGTAAHEFTHLLGGFRNDRIDNRIDEPSTDIIANTILDDPSAMHKAGSCYMWHTELLNDALTRANISTVQFSKLFSGHTFPLLDAYRLLRAGKTEDGSNPLIEHHRVVRDEYKFWKKHVNHETAYVLSGIRLVQLAQGGTYTEIAKSRLAFSIDEDEAEDFAQRVGSILKQLDGNEDA